MSSIALAGVAPEHVDSPIDGFEPVAITRRHPRRENLHEPDRSVIGNDKGLEAGEKGEGIHCARTCVWVRVHPRAARPRVDSRPRRHHACCKHESHGGPHSRSETRNSEGNRSKESEKNDTTETVRTE